MHTMEYDSGICLFLWSGKNNLTAAASASLLVKWYACSDFAKAMSLPCISKNTLRFLTLVKQKLIGCFFASFAMEPFQSFGA